MGWLWFGRREEGGRAAGAERQTAGVTDWPSTLKHMPVFRGLSDDVLTEMCVRMEPVRVKTGQVIIREGDEGDYYYAIVAGRARVTRKSGASGVDRAAAEALSAGVLVEQGRRSKLDPDTAAAHQQQDVALLQSGVGFGEEALVSGLKRNATVTMVEGGVLMRLSRQDFNELLKAPRLKWLSGPESASEVQRGAKYLDVRSEREHLWGNLQGSTCIPLQDLRERAAELDRDVLHICYCESGRQSATAAFLLSQMGFRAAVLRGGLRRL
jgi:rhodanese-related sulfurtransferase